VTDDASHDTLPRSTPEEQGLPSTAIEAFVDRLEALGLEPHSLMVLRHGHVVAEGWWTPYHRAGVQLLYSLSKSFTSTAVGLAVGEGRFALTDRLADTFPAAAQGAGPRAQALTVHDALSMSTGHRLDSLEPMLARPDAFEEAFFGYEPEEPVGTWFVYDNGATFMSGAVTQHHVGERLVDYLRPRLLDPIGAGPAAWQRHTDGRDLGFTGLFLRTEAIARFGLLLLADGMWHGGRVLPAGWAATATSALTDNTMNDATVDWQQGYGYQFWRCRHGAVRGDGAYGQFCVLLPDQDAVVVITSSTENMPAELDAIWDLLLPAFADAPLPPDPAADNRLTTRLAEATMTPLSGTETPATVGPWRFDHVPTEEHPALTALTVTATADGFVLMADDGAPVTAVCGNAAWPAADADTSFVASGGWTDPDTFEAVLVALQSPHHVRLRGRLSTGRLEARWNTVPLRRRSLSDLAAPF
jgi:CubicO group peptidase (beta-lactamase class C family)